MPISQKPKQIFDLDIGDETVRQNFERLNRELQLLQGSKRRQPANYVFSVGEFEEYGGAAGEFRPPGLVLTITTRGNPVQLEIVPSKDLRVRTSGLLTGGVTSYVAARPGAPLDIAYFYHGIYRKTNGSEVLLYKQLNLLKGAAAVTYDTTVNFNKFIDTNAPAGVHTYQFFVEAAGPVFFTSVGFYNVSLFAEEK